MNPDSLHITHLSADQEKRVLTATRDIVRINQEFFLNNLDKRGDRINGDEYFRELINILSEMYAPRVPEKIID